ncbi:hypothetical protein NliqN6_0808 [Naganishia liquefaciens]|uniref:DUF1748 domain-containing protein n=1 Tax=Naganishia liquefaciens TaxID=104408 RepID=A0A8H3TNH9_9TREE|nr:hypothetical protein NliqN6_0808 [Naganishia liquefaciens]
MALGRLLHYGFDLLAVSTVLAGVKKSTGYAPETKQIESEGIRSVVDSYLSVGDSVFSTISGMAVGSQWFGRKL